jgi:hypothetical protein
MIYFTIPASSTLVVSDLNIYIDREPQAASSLSLFQQGFGPSRQVGRNGINIRDEIVTFTIKNVPAVRAILLNDYFTRLRTSNLTLVYPEGSKNYYIQNWSISIKNQAYSDVAVTAELMYL